MITTLLLALVTAVPVHEAFRPASDPAVTVKNTRPVVLAIVPPAVQDDPEVRDETYTEDPAAAAPEAAACMDTPEVAPVGALAGALVGATAAGLAPDASSRAEAAAAKCREPVLGASSGLAASIRAVVQNFRTVRCSAAVSAASCTAGRGAAAAVPVVSAAPGAAGKVRRTMAPAAKLGTARAVRRRAEGCMPTSVSGCPDAGR
ncbi:hypothetical protein GCM10023074_54090 [Microbispora amethystogenes]|uniref:Uncharacterized protein n=1 Tax=Microbispora amethystogenes TaxID=1427754 RepID=A0ABQ4FHG9_9ACTN|nr:hypothetical protein Mam01_44510 [Microbispora amethystogenes]